MNNIFKDQIKWHFEPSFIFTNIQDSNIFLIKVRNSIFSISSNEYIMNVAVRPNKSL